MNAIMSTTIRERLISERERIIAEWRNHGGHTGPGDDWNLRDLEERAVQIASESVDRRIADDDLNLLRKVEHALKRLENGTHDQCEQCGGAIPPERLMAKPSVSLCVACQEDKDATKH